MQEKLNDNDAIIDYLLGNRSHSELSKPQQRKLERLYTCKDLILQHGVKKKVLSIMMTTYKDLYSKENKTYSRRTSESDYVATQEVFGTTAKHNRDFHIEILLQEMAETRHMAKVTQNATALARCDANKAHMIEKFMGDKDTPDYSKVQVPVQIFGFNPNWLEAYKSGKMPSDDDLLEEIKLLEQVDEKKKLKFNPEKVELAKIIEDYDKKNRDSSAG